MSDRNKSDQETLREQAEALSSAIATRLKRADRWNLFFRIGLILGGGLAATIGGFMAPTAAGETPWKAIVGIGGALMVLVGGIILTVIERDYTNDLDKARRALDSAQTFLANRDQLLRQFEDIRRLDSKRRNLIAALQAMREAAEQTAYSGSTNAEKAIGDLFDVSLTQLLAAMGYESGEFHSVNVYRRTFDQGKEVLERLVDRRSNRLEEHTSTRKWARGEGYTGIAWQNDNEVIVHDAQAQTAIAAFHVPKEKYRPSDPRKYRSVAAFPIRVGPDAKIWGVVTITSDKVGRFSPIQDEKGAQNVEAARAVAGMVALLAGFAYMNQKNGLETPCLEGENDDAEAGN